MKTILWNLALIAILSPITAALAQRNMTIVDLLNLPSVTDPQLSPDGSQILFIRGDSGGEARRLFEHKPGVSNIAWSPDGTSILFVAPDPEPKADRKRKQAKDDVFAFEEEFRQKHLWQFQITGSKPLRITEGDFSVLDYKLSLDGS